MNYKLISKAVGVVTVSAVALFVGCKDSGVDPNNGGGGDQFNPNISYTSFKDNRDNKSYKSVKIGRQTWMAEILSYKAGGSKCYGEGGKAVVGWDYEKDEPIKKTLSAKEIQENCTEYGRLYNWTDARTACPSGWHLPTIEEWEQLEDAVGGEYAGAGGKLKATSGWCTDDDRYGNGTDDYGFSALPGGYGGYFYDRDDRVYFGFDDVDNYGYWWSATEYEERFDDPSAAWHRRMDCDGIMYGMDQYQTDVLSVRCVQD